MKKWLFYNLLVVFAVYWLSNLVLWFPWSINPWLGMTLMLTVAPVFWGFAAYLCLRTFPGNKLFKGAFFISIIFTVLAVIMDYIFFGIIRDAMDELYHPTTFYGYGFVVCLPFIMVLGFGKKIESKRRSVSSSGLITAGAIGLTCLTLLILIIRLKIEL